MAPTKRAGLALNPLDEIQGVPPQRAEAPELKAPAVKSTSTPATTSPLKATKTARRERTTFNLDSELLERVRNAVWWERLALVDVAEEALRREVRRLEKKHNGGELFPQRKRELRPGRKVAA